MLLSSTVFCWKPDLARLCHVQTQVLNNTSPFMICMVLVVDTIRFLVYWDLPNCFQDAGQSSKTINIFVVTLIPAVKVIKV